VLFLCYFSCNAQKKFLFIALLSWFLILGKIPDGGKNGDHCWWRHRPPETPPPIKCTPSCKEGQRLSTKCKIVSKYSNIWKTPGRGAIHPPPPLYRGMTLRALKFPSLILNKMITIYSEQRSQEQQLYLPNKLLLKNKTSSKQRQHAVPPAWLGIPFISTKFSVTLGQVAASCVAKLTTVSFRAPSTVTWFTRGLLHKKIKSTYEENGFHQKLRLIKWDSQPGGSKFNTRENSRSTAP